MKRLCQRALNVVTVLAVLLCVAATSAWFWTEGRAVSVGWRGEAREGFLSASTGEIACSACVAASPASGFDGKHGWLITARPRPVDFRREAERRRWQWQFLRAGFGLRKDDEPGSAYAYYGAMAPCWFLVVVTATLPAVRLLRWCRARAAARRSQAGECRACSYDLTGNVSGVCPECGTAAVKGNA